MIRLLRVLFVLFFTKIKTGVVIKHHNGFYKVVLVTDIKDRLSTMPQPVYELEYRDDLMGKTLMFNDRVDRYTKTLFTDYFKTYEVRKIVSIKQLLWVCRVLYKADADRFRFSNRKIFKYSSLMTLEELNKFKRELYKHI